MVCVVTDRVEEPITRVMRVYVVTDRGEEPIT